MTTETEDPYMQQFDGAADGSHLVISGAVHGNETCGPEAIARALQGIDEGRIKITHGTVSFIRAANPMAYKYGYRYIDRNLNRSLYPRRNPRAYEDYIGNELCRIYRQADELLDLHSFNAPGQAFIFLGPPRRQEADFARALGVNNFAHGWQESYGEAEADQQRDPRESQGTTEYTRQWGASALTLECGSHKDPESIEVAFQAILNALEYCGLADIDPDLFDPRPVSLGPETCVKLTDVFYKTEQGHFAKPWKNMDPVKKGELLATFNSGATITAPEDGFVIMPVEDERVGDEWFHFGVPSDYFLNLS